MLSIVLLGHLNLFWIQVHVQKRMAIFIYSYVHSLHIWLNIPSYVQFLQYLLYALSSDCFLLLPFFPNFTS